MSVDEYLSRLPDRYNKKTKSINEKIMTLAAGSHDSVVSTLETIRLWRDIDNAEGTTLDRIGDDIGQKRDGMNDVEYRKMLKVKRIINFSGGEIETINRVCDALLGDRYVGLREGWTLPVGYPIAPEEAMQLLTVFYDGERFGIPFELLEMAKTGGVKINWESQGETTLQISTEASTHSQRYALCGTFSANQVVI